LDPAFVSGSFLLGAYQYLLDWHHNWYIADAAEKWLKGKGATLRPGPAGQPLLTSKERKRILLDNVFGVDIDYQAVEVTKLSLLLKVLEGETTESVEALSKLFHERALPDLGDNIKCGNSLIGPDIYESEGGRNLTAEEKTRINAFDWKGEFQGVFSQGGFDAVIGNPPYGALAREPETRYFRNSYGTLANSLDSFIIFVERSARLLKTNGHVGLIVPSGWVSAPSARPLRQFFLEHYIPQAFVSLPFDVFAGAYIDTVIFIAKRQITVAEAASGLPLELVVFPHRYRITDISDFDKYRKFGNTKGWAGVVGGEFLIVSSTAESELLQKIRRQPTNIDNYVLLKRGVETYTLREKAEGVKNATLAFDGVLQRYVLEPQKPKYLNYSKEIRESKPWEFFSHPRILLRQILSRKLRIQATFTKDAFLTNQSVQSLILRAELKQSALLHWLLGILNSKLVSWYFVNFNSVARRDDFPKIIIKQTRELPIPHFESGAKSKKLASLVQSMLSLHKSELAAKTPQQKETIHREIEATDRRIDEPVYELYGLNKEEIRLVEEGTA